MNLAQIVAENRANIILSRNNKDKIIEITWDISSIENSDLLEIKWIWESTAKILIDAGFCNKEKLMEATTEEINKLQISPISKGVINKLINK